jgi:hypothetical protein
MLTSVPQVAGYLRDLDRLLRPTERAPQHNVPSVKDSAPTCPNSPEPVPLSHSLYHILYMLYTIRPIACLPQHMKDWIEGRISWMEEQADPYDLMGLQDTVLPPQRSRDGWRDVQLFQCGV